MNDSILQVPIWMDFEYRTDSQCGLRIEVGQDLAILGTHGNGRGKEFRTIGAKNFLLFGLKSVPCSNRRLIGGGEYLRVVGEIAKGRACGEQEEVIKRIESVCVFRFL